MWYVHAKEAVSLSSSWCKSYPSEPDTKEKSSLNKMLTFQKNAKMHLTRGEVRRHFTFQNIGSSQIYQKKWVSVGSITYWAARVLGCSQNHIDGAIWCSNYNSYSTFSGVSPAYIDGHLTWLYSLPSLCHFPTLLYCLANVNHSLRPNPCVTCSMETSFDTYKMN